MTRPALILLVFLALAGCNERPSDLELRDRVDTLEQRVAHLEKQRDMLAQASIDNSAAIKSLSDAIRNNSESIVKLARR